MKLPLTPIHVAMITFNGTKYLQAQLDSLAAQSVLPSALWVSDDGSTDGTIQILRKFKEKAPFSVFILAGPKWGASANMASLVSKMPPESIATCDQDDIWLPNRLKDIRNWLTKSDQSAPTIHVCTRKGFIGRSQAKHRHSFANALVENRAPGNASTFNPAAVRLLQSHAVRLPPATPFFDWWAYQLVLGAGGNVINDKKCGVFYRAHRNNTLGPRWNPRGILTRVSALLDGTYKSWILNQARALSLSNASLSPKNRLILEQFLLSARNNGSLGPVHRLSHMDQILLRLVWHFPTTQKFNS